MFQGSLFGSTLRAGIFRQASRVYGSCSDLTSHAFLQRKAPAFSGLNKNDKIQTHLEPSIFGNMGMKLGLVGVAGSVSLPRALSFKSFIHSGDQAIGEAGRQAVGEAGRQEVVEGGRQPDVDPRRPRRSIDHFQDLMSYNGRPPLDQPQVESNADIVHIKLMRNNSFVTLTDSKGNKKIGVSAGKLAKGGIVGRYSGEAAAEDIGGRVRQMKTRSVVVKVNGFTFFRRKKDAILAFKDGYTNSRGDTNPIVYIEDTTRKPHNGCRRSKKRRI